MPSATGGTRRATRPESTLRRGRECDERVVPPGSAFLGDAVTLYLGGRYDRLGTKGRSFYVGDARYGRQSGALRVGVFTQSRRCPYRLTDTVRPAQFSGQGLPRALQFRALQHHRQRESTTARRSFRQTRNGGVVGCRCREGAGRSGVPQGGVLRHSDERHDLPEVCKRIPVACWG